MRGPASLEDLGELRWVIPQKVLEPRRLTSYLVAVGRGRGAGIGLTFGNNVLLVTKSVSVS